MVSCEPMSIQIQTLVPVQDSVHVEINGDCFTMENSLLKAVFSMDGLLKSLQHKPTGRCITWQLLYILLSDCHCAHPTVCPSTLKTLCFYNTCNVQGSHSSWWCWKPVCSVWWPSPVLGCLGCDGVSPWDQVSSNLHWQSLCHWPWSVASVSRGNVCFCSYYDSDYSFGLI